MAFSLILSRRAKNSSRCLRRRQTELVEDFLVVDEAVDHRSHRHTIDRRTIVRGPSALRDVRKTLHAGDVVDRREIPFLEEVERGVERPAGDEVAGSAVLQAGFERGVVFRRHARFEDHVDVGVGHLESGNDHVLPDAASAVLQLSIVRVALSSCASDPPPDAANASAAHNTIVQPSFFAERIPMSPTALAGHRP